MSTMDSRAIEKRTNKKFIVKNSKAIKQYALNSHKKSGNGIIVINLALIENDLLTAKDLIVRDYDQDNSNSEVNTLIRPISYLISNSFWFKIIRIKIKKKYEIDIQSKYDLNKQCLLVFVKDSALDSFSIYSIKIDKHNA